MSSEKLIFSENCSPILKWEFPDTIKAGEEIKIKVWYPLENNCGKFARFEEKIQDNRVTLGVICAYPENQMCQAVSKVELVEYKFKPSTKGTYLFAFVACNEVFKNCEIEVQ
ncbi:MAG: hypothetical protein OHK0038_19370 [Flammeovirgaceae bacterium]